MNVISRVREPEYTGENRCWPCTTVNVLIALVLAGVVDVALLTVANASTSVAGGAALAVLVVSAASIWLRGYLVPGTPTLTKRYMPESVLRLFGKEPEHPMPTAGDTREVDPETYLSDAGAIEPCDDIDDVCLTEAFAERWDDALAAIEEPGPEDVRAVFGLGDGDYDLDFRAEAVILERDGQRAGEWPSRTALRVDIAGGHALADSDRDAWADLDPIARGRVLNGLRVFLEDCPDGGPVEMKEETVESCCNAYEVVALTCADSGERVLEQRVT
ncbi:hypothetical protein [Haloarchaeobius salinus]|uniref:hypothetical protein n=1 Tax=Haloarchaeobius salinus TaxID=1198298 RepID=UPI00210BA1D0|nr:hypothetical protein [Haloarchaeobius salinus]